MKKLHFLGSSGMIMALAIIVQPVCLAQKPAVKCPELSKPTPRYDVAKKKKANYKTISFSSKEFNKKSQFRLNSPNNQMTSTADLKSSPTEFERITNLTKLEYNRALFSSADNNSLIIPEISIPIPNNSLSERNSISKIPGKGFIILNNPVENVTLQDVPAQKIEGLGLAGMIVGLAGFFIAGIPCGIIATIFGAISLNRIKKHPDKFRGKGFALASLIIGIVVLGLTILILV